MFNFYFQVLRGYEPGWLTQNQTKKIDKKHWLEDWKYTI